MCQDTGTAIIMLQRTNVLQVSMMENINQRDI